MDSHTKIVLEGGVELTVPHELSEVTKVLAKPDSNGLVAFTRSNASDLMVSTAHVLYLEEHAGEIQLTDPDHSPF
jgi:hypothetical protein